MRAEPESVLAAQLQLYTPGLLDSLVEAQTRLRIDYGNMPIAPHEKARDFMRATTAFLELLHVSAVGLEVAWRLGATNQRELMSHSDDFTREVCALTKLSLDRVFAENKAIIVAILHSQGSTSEDQDQDLPDLDKVVSAVNSILQTCPVKDLVELGNSLEMTEHASRCQVTFDGLSHFIRRHDAWMPQRLKVVGMDYTLGKSSIEDVAEVLELPIADTVALLEDHGYSRPLAQVALSETARSEYYAQMRECRLARADKPSADPNRVARTVVASQRIEGIDARPWVHSGSK
jgi:hypothetical protein